MEVDVEGKVQSVCVDGREVGEGGWKWANGWLGEEYGWVVYWRGDEGDGRADVEDVGWDEFIRVFNVLT